LGVGGEDAGIANGGNARHFAGEQGRVIHGFPHWRVEARQECGSILPGLRVIEIVVRPQLRDAGVCRIIVEEALVILGAERLIIALANQRRVKADVRLVVVRGISVRQEHVAESTERHLSSLTPSPSISSGVPYSCCPSTTETSVVPL
jgi:hypothetical protein